MCKCYDKVNKLWGNLEENGMKNTNESLGQAILDLLVAHGSKVAQVQEIYSLFSFD